MEWDLIYLPIKNNNPERFIEIKIFEEAKNWTRKMKLIISYTNVD